MKKIFSLILASLFVMQLIGQDTKPLIIKRTATWCPFCGTWGWDFMEDVLVEFEDNAVVLGMHFSGDLQSPVATAWANNIGGSGQPKFYFNNTDLVVRDNNGSEILEELKTRVEDYNNFPLFKIDIAGSYNSTIDGFVSIVDVTPEISSIENDVYVGVYLVENNVTNNQSSIGITKHPRVLRAAIDGNDFGMLAFRQGSVSSTDLFSNNYAVIDPSGADKDLDILAVVFEKLGDTYQILQAEILTEIDFVSNNNDELEGSNAFNYLINADKQFQLKVNLDQPVASASVTIFNHLGQKIITDQVSNFGTQLSETYDLSAQAPGAYIIYFEFEDKYWSEQFIIAN